MKITPRRVSGENLLEDSNAWQFRSLCVWNRLILRAMRRLRRNAPLPCRHFMPSRRGGARSSQARNICLKSGQKVGCFCMLRIALQRHVLEDKLGQYHSTEKRGGLYFHTQSLSFRHTHTVLWGGSRCCLQALCLLRRYGVDDNIPEWMSPHWFSFDYF